MALLEDLRQKDCCEFEPAKDTQPRIQGYKQNPVSVKPDSNSSNNKTNKTQENYFLTHLGREKLGFQLRPGAPSGKQSGPRQRRARPSIVMNIQLQGEHLSFSVSCHPVAIGFIRNLVKSTAG